MMARSIQKNQIILTVKLEIFFSVIQYLGRCTQPTIKFDIFAWMVLNKVPQWNVVDETVSYLNIKDVTFEDSVYEELIYLKSFIEAEMPN